MGEWQPLIWTLIILFGLAAFLPALVSTDVGDYDQSTYLQPLIDRVYTGINVNPLQLFGFGVPITINPFSWFGSSVQDYVASSIILFTFIPVWLAVPAIIIVIVAIVYGIMRFLPTK